MYNETYAPILSVIERDFVRGDAARGTLAPSNDCAPCGCGPCMRPRSSFGQGSSGRGMARAIAKVAQVLL